MQSRGQKYETVTKNWKSELDFIKKKQMNIRKQNVHTIDFHQKMFMLIKKRLYYYYVVVFLTFLLLQFILLFVEFFFWGNYLSSSCCLIIVVELKKWTKDIYGNTTKQQASISFLGSIEKIAKSCGTHKIWISLSYFYAHQIREMGHLSSTALFANSLFTISLQLNRDWVSCSLVRLRKR